VWVHVADPTRWLVTPGSPVDLEARGRTRTLYLPFGSVPMFPECLSEGAFSLRSSGGEAGQSAGAEAPICCALSVSATLDADGALQHYEFTPSYIQVTHRVTYDEADADLALGPEGCNHRELQQLYEIARLRWVLGLAWLGLAWLGLAWLGLAWLGLAWLGFGLGLVS